MQSLQTPDGHPLDAVSTKLYHALASLARLNFLLVGMMLIAGNMLCAASVFGLAIPLYKAGALETLLAGGFTLGQPIRKRLGLCYAIALILPELGLIWAGIEQIRYSVIPPWDMITAVGGCAALMNLLEAMRLARYRPDGFPLMRAMVPPLRGSLPYSLAVIIAGLATAVSHTAWIDLATGIGITLLNFRAPKLLDRVAQLEVVDTAWETRTVRGLVADYPALAILLTPTWQEAAQTYRRLKSLRGNLG